MRLDLALHAVERVLQDAISIGLTRRKLTIVDVTALRANQTLVASGTTVFITHQWPHLSTAKLMPPSPRCPVPFTITEHASWFGAAPATFAIGLKQRSVQPCPVKVRGRCRSTGPSNGCLPASPVKTGKPSFRSRRS